ncbi:MAG: DNA polymerase III subunit alpha [Verrucomicrobiota bacterium]|nr:DNA polymerase III subunit alpha [Verrucomicrobiota bacterium]
MIIHLDADAFFASVEQAADPQLRGRPIVVGGLKRGVVASPSYEARKFGIYTTMPTVRARKLCPQLIILPGDFEKYERFSRFMFSYAYDFTPMVEIGSIDEGYFDITGYRRKNPMEIAETIRSAIKDSLKISVSEGVGSNKLVSQIASKLKKPFGLTEVNQGCERTFLDPLKNEWLPGVGPQLGATLNAAGLARIGQIAEVPAHFLTLLVGKQAPVLKQFSLGIDDRPVIPEAPDAKSYGQQETFETDVTDEEFLLATLRRMADTLMAKVRADEKSIRTVTVRIRYNDMSENMRSESLEEPTCFETDTYSLLARLFKKAWERRVSLRLVSLKLSHVYTDLFSERFDFNNGGLSLAKNVALASAVDQIKRAMGRQAVMRGHDLWLKARDEKPREDLNRFATVHSSHEPYGEEPSPADDYVDAHKANAGVTFVGREWSGTGRPPMREQTRQIAVNKAGLNIHTPPACITPLPLLNVKSQYSFLDSTLSLAVLLLQAEKSGIRAVAITDPNLHGAVEFFNLAKSVGIKPVTGAELRFCDQRFDPHFNLLQPSASGHTKTHPSRINVYVKDKTGYQNLCHLLSQSHLTWAMYMDHREGLIQLPAQTFQARRIMGIDKRRIFAPEVRYLKPDDKIKYEIVQSIRTLTRLHQDHPRKRRGSDFHFLNPAESFGISQHNACSLHASLDLVEECSFELELGGLRFPHYHPADGTNAHAFLRTLALAGARQRYNGTTLERVLLQVDEELRIITEVGYEEYFLLVWDILQECRKLRIDWITRGSAADSLVCYCLGISTVCPVRFDLYFKRFLNPERMALNKLPDIDIDFAHDRKDDVVDLIFRKHGSHHAAIVGGLSTYQGRSAFADIAKVLGVSEYQIRRVTEHIPYSRASTLKDSINSSLETRDLPLDEEPYKSALELASILDGFPRYPKMHPCGVVLSRDPLHHLTPLFQSHKGYPTTHFDMDSVEAVGLIKMDILAQGGLAAMRDAIRMIDHQGHDLTRSGLCPNLADEGTIHDRFKFLEPWSDPNVWEMISSGNARGVHHIESPAMISLCRMCNVQDIDCLIAIVSVIRPGAANEMKKVQFARRYQKLEEPQYIHPSLEPVLKSTYGVIAYEEHILQICEAFAGITPGKADTLRRALTKENTAAIEAALPPFIEGAKAMGRTEAEITSVWDFIYSFRGYAFCRAHSTAYGVEAYQAAYLKCYFPIEFMAAVLSNGKGFYSSLVYSLETRRLGIGFLLPDINVSLLDYAPEPPVTPPRGTDALTDSPVLEASSQQFIRVPLRTVKGLSQATLGRYWIERQKKEFVSLEDFYIRVHPDIPEMEILIRTGAFDRFGYTRTGQFWQWKQLYLSWGKADKHGQGELFAPSDNKVQIPTVPLTEPTLLDRLKDEAELIGFSVSAHPLDQFPAIAWDTYCPIKSLHQFPNQTVVICGLIIEERVHSQSTGELMKFISLCDYTGMVETELFSKTYKRFGLATVRHPVVELTGIVHPFDNGLGFTLQVDQVREPRAT